MDLSPSLFPLEDALPEHARPPRVEGRILVGGQIVSEGFARKEVRSHCCLRTSAGELLPTLLGTTPQIDVEWMMRAVDAARAAWADGTGPWPTAHMEDRIAAIERLRHSMSKLREPIVRLLMWEIGKSRRDSEAEFDRTLIYIDDTVLAAKQLDRDGSRLQFADGIFAQVRRAPLGVTLCMGPFNYPLNETFTTLIPALVVGNPVVVKAPRFGQLLWDFLLEPFRDSFPPGVLNLVDGEGRTIIGPAMRSGKIDVLAFIGSSGVADLIKTAHPHPHRLRSVLGLDAKNPAILLPDCDLPHAVAECVRGALSFNGQRCTALKILFVHRTLADAFVPAFAAAVEALRPGMPWDPDVAVTPLPDAQKPPQLQSFIEEALNGGARLVNPRGGATVGTLFFPAVLAGVPLSCRAAREEQFGPLVPIAFFDELREVEEHIIASPYGMQASIFGRDPRTVGPLVDVLVNQVCRVNLNAQCQRGPDVFPFTGRKDSAEGTLSVTDALRAFSIRSMVAAKQDAPGRALVRAIFDGDHSRFLSTHVVL